MVTQRDQRAGTWKPIPGCSGYEASDNSVWRPGDDGKLVQVTGGIRSIDRIAGGKRLRGVLLKGRLNSSGYVLVNVTDDEGVKRTVIAHRVILLAHVGECPEGQETLHSERGPLWCRVPEDMRYGTKPENAADRKAAGTAKTPATYPCVNHERCGGMVVKDGSRCLPCVQEVGREAAAMLDDGVGLDEVTGRLGYRNPAWVHKLACQFGGYTGTQAKARAQRQPWSRRVMTTLRRILSRGDAR
jgi:hypothetical protein